MTTKAVYYCEGMKLFGETLVRYYNYKRYDPKTDLELPTLFEGLYFQQCYDAFKNHKGERTVYWNGSDVYRLQMNPSWQEILRTIPAKHLCGSAQYVKELAELGITGEHYPLFFGDISKFEPSFKVRDKTHVYMTAHPSREGEYGVPLAIELAEKTDVVLHIYGINGPSTDKVVYHGFVIPEVMDEEIKEYHGAIKLIARDGLSQTVAKSALLGQYPISVNRIEGVWHAPSKELLIAYLTLLKEKKEPNMPLREKYLNIFKRGI